MTERSESTDTEEQIAEWQRHNARLLVELLEWKSGPVEVFRSILVESGWPSHDLGVSTIPRVAPDR